MTTRYLLVQIKINDGPKSEYGADINMSNVVGWSEYQELFRRISQLSFGASYVLAAFELTDDGLRNDHELVVRTRQ